MNTTTSVFLHGMLDDIQPACKFRAQSLAQWRGWRQHLRQRLQELAGTDKLAGYARDRDEAVRYGKIEEMDGYSRQEIRYCALKGLYTQAFLLTPHRQGDGRAAVALHGHGRGVEDVMGIAVAEEDRAFIHKNNYDYAVQLARRGYRVIAPNLQGFGVSRSHGVQGWECDALQPLAVMAGTTLLAVKLYEVARAIDVLQAQPGVDAERIACLGLSGGGQMTLYISALDERIKAAVVSGYICQFRDSILAMDHCRCNYVPGLSLIAESSDIAALIAPRPLFVESGTLDDIFPVQSAIKAVALARKAYELLGAQDKLAHDVFEGGHRFHGEEVFGFLTKQL